MNMAMADVVISFSKITGSGVCVTSQDGQRVYAQLYEALAGGHRVSLSFSGVTRMTTAFLNSAVGQLYGEFPADEIRKRMLAPIDAEPWHLSRLKMVNDRAKQYFSNKEAYNRILELGIGSGKDEHH